jgi:hypothetical protein
MASDDSRARYLASGQGETPSDAERLDLIGGLLAGRPTWAEPPPHVLDGVLAVVGGERVREEAKAPTRRSWPVVAGVMGTAAALIALVIASVSVIESRATSVLALTGTELQAGASGTATVRPTGSGWWIRLDVAGLTPAPEGTYYEGWVWSDDGEGVSIGTFHLRGEEGPIILWSGVEMTDYPSLWVTLEEEDGAAAASDQLVLQGRLPGDGAG